MPGPCLIAWGHVQGEEQPAETEWGRQLVEAEHSDLILQQQLCGQHTWTYLLDHLQLNLSGEAPCAIAASTLEEYALQAAQLARRVKTAIR